MESNLTLFASIRWQDIVDILLTSYILFRFYVLFRGTNVFRVITGIAVLWFFQRIAVKLGLIVTSWVMQGFTAVAALIIIIVFRNEIRIVLQAKDLKAILWGFTRKGAHTPVEVIVASVYELSRRKTGALIVLPGREDLDDIVQSGLPWRGIISKEMLLSVFWPDNPVHDGAVTIKGNRISQVGVILPLTHVQDLPSRYGTRHRAALGLAESSDALVVVVSEETGKVAVAKGSQLIEITDNVALARKLLDHVGLTVEEGHYLKREKLHLGAAALVSVLLITGVWFSFTRGQDTLVTFEVPVEYMKPDPGMEILATSVNTVTLHLSGSSSLIQSTRPEQVKARLDLGNAVVGSNRYTINAQNISLPPGIALSRVDPPQVEVTLDVPLTRELPVQADWAGSMPDGLILESIQLKPDRIRVIGGSRYLNRISTVYTQKIPLDSIKQSGTMTSRLVFNAPYFRLEPGGKEAVEITCVVKERPAD